MLEHYECALIGGKLFFVGPMLLAACMQATRRRANTNSSKLANRVQSDLFNLLCFRVYSLLLFCSVLVHHHFDRRRSNGQPANQEHPLGSRLRCRTVNKPTSVELRTEPNQTGVACQFRFWFSHSRQQECLNQQ